MSFPAFAIIGLHRLRSLLHVPLVGATRSYGIGYLPDRRVVRLAQRDSREFWASTTIQEGSLASSRGPQLDQNQCGSCTGHGTAQAVFTSAAAAGHPMDKFPSPWACYGTVRELELTDSSQALTDSGAMPSDLITVATKWGFMPIGYGMTPALPPTPDGYYSDCWSGNVNDKPSLLQLEQSAMRLDFTAIRVDETAVDFGAQISAAIENKSAGGVGIFVDTTNFMQWDPSSGPINTINTADPNGGGHWLEFDYTYMLNGQQIVGGDNSWGLWNPPSGAVSSPFWKPGGWEMTLACLRQVCSDCLVFQVAP